VVRFLVTTALLPLWQLHFWAGYLLVGDLAEEVADDVQPRAPLIVGMGDEPGRPGAVRGLEHLVARARVVVPAAVGLQVHRGQLPDLAPVVDAGLEAARLLLRAYLEPILQDRDAGVDHGLLDGRHRLQEEVRLLIRAEAHDAFDAGAVVPAAVEDHDLPRRRQVTDVALDIHLRFLALGRGGQGNHAEDAR